MAAPILVCLDFETYYDPSSGYTLSKMTNEAYVRNARFEPLCLGVAADGYEPFYVEQHNLREYLASLPWDNMQVIFHHAQFDGLILSHYYGHSPKVIIDTLSMARAANFPKGMSLSLASLSKHFGLPDKTVPYGLFQGKRWSEMSGDVRQALCNGAARDAANTLEIAKRFLHPNPNNPTHASIAEVFGIGGFPREELVAIDWTVRAYTEPKLKGNIEKLEQVSANEEQRKAALLANLGLTRADLASNPKFASILEALGVEVEQKANANGELIPAVAKSDSFMKELLIHEDSVIVDLAETRIAVKSTQRETRAQRMADMAKRGPMCVYYYYCGAQNTTRHSGGDGYNWQNIERKGPIRACIEAPKGYTLIIADKSQIECRILNTACGQWNVVEKFRNNEDIYCYNASSLYGHEVIKSEHPEKRGTGKQIELSCGYGCGATKFQATAALGIYGPPVKLTLSESDAAVTFYRDGHDNVCGAWEQGNYILRQWSINGIFGSEFELMGIKYKDGLAYLPGGLKLDYRTVEWDSILKQYFFHHKKSFVRNVEEYPPVTKAERWVWWHKKGYRKLYGAKMVEQLTQALSAVDYRQTCTRLVLKHKLYPVMSSHDEAVYVVPTGEANEWKEIVHAEFARAPHWLPDMPGAAEVTISERYTK